MKTTLICLLLAQNPAFAGEAAMNRLNHAAAMGKAQRSAGPDEARGLALEAFEPVASAQGVQRSAGVTANRQSSVRVSWPANRGQGPAFRMQEPPAPGKAFLQKGTPRDTRALARIGMGAAAGMLLGAPLGLPGMAAGLCIGALVAGASSSRRV